MARRILDARATSRVVAPVLMLGLLMSATAGAAVDLGQILSCSDWASIATEPGQIRPRLQEVPGVHCEHETSRDGEMLTCHTDQPAEVFGRTITEFSLGRVNRSVYRLRYVLPVPLETLREQIETLAGRRFEPHPKFGYVLDLAGTPERSYRLDVREDGLTELICRVRVPNTSSEAQATGADAMHGGVTGAIEFPGEAIPPMRVCAVPTDRSRSTERRCELTTAGQDGYAIGNLAAGEYYVIGYPQRDNPNGWIMGHAERLGDCGEGRPDCAAALLSRVLVRGDSVVEKIDVVQAFTDLAPHLADLETEPVN